LYNILYSILLMSSSIKHPLRSDKRLDHRAIVE